MDSDALAPFGLALVAYLEGDTESQLTVRRDDGIETFIPVSHFFRPPSEFTPIELAALERCHGHVLDIGAGTGLHSLDLQSRGLAVTPIDISPHAVDVMVKRGVTDARCADVFELKGGPFDSLLMLGHGIGIVGHLAGLERFLGYALQLTSSSGQLLIHSMDVRQTEDPMNLAYHDVNLTAGRYVGEIRIQFEFQGRTGPYCDWLHVEPQVLSECATAVGWTCALFLEQAGGDYLARLTPAV